jgi:hypothetical protein
MMRRSDDRLTGTPSRQWMMTIHPPLGDAQPRPSVTTCCGRGVSAFPEQWRIHRDRGGYSGYTGTVADTADTPGLWRIQRIYRDRGGVIVCIGCIGTVADTPDTPGPWRIQRIYRDRGGVIVCIGCIGT